MARDAPSIDAYGQGGFRLSGVWRAGSVLILDDEARDWPVADASALTVDSLSAVIAAGPRGAEFLLLGMGLRNALPRREVREAVRAAGLGLEFMDTPSAARTYHVLCSDCRRVAASLFAVVHAALEAVAANGSVVEALPVRGNALNLLSEQETKGLHMAGILANFRTTIIVSLVLAIIMMFFYGTGSPQQFDLAFWQAVLRWAHAFFGILWIGLLYYFNFVQIRKMPDIPAELKPAVSKYIAPEALFWFRWAALFTLIAGILLAFARGADYAVGVLSIGATTGFQPNHTFM